jgi:hypothetical protein
VSAASVRRAPPTPLGRAEAEALLVRLGGTMDALVHVLEAETALTRAGKLAEAARMHADKAELSRRYFQDAAVIEANAAALKQLAPDLVAGVRARHQSFRANLQINMTVLATARTVAESIVAEIADTVARQDRPSAYDAGGGLRQASPKTSRPIALSRSL